MLEMMIDGEAAVDAAVAEFVDAVAVVGAAAVAMVSWVRSLTKQLNNCYYYCHYSYCNVHIAAAAAAAMHYSVRCCCLATGHDAVAVT